VDFTGGVTGAGGFPGRGQSRRVITARTGRPASRSAGAEFRHLARDVAIRLPPTSQSGEEIRARKIEQSCTASMPGRDSAGRGGRSAGRRRTEEQRHQALAATLLLIFGYIALRFHTWRLSLGAILAVLHDPILVLGMFSLTRTSFDLTVVAAMLAVIGYSLNDTVVVFDRIRERFQTSRRLDPVAVLDQSINQTLSRTIMTKVVTLIVVVALYALGGPALQGLLRGADHRHPRRHLFLDLHLERHGAGLRPQGRAPAGDRGEEAGRRPALPRRLGQPV
jgi:preprotein translocase subunit SecF